MRTAPASATATATGIVITLDPPARRVAVQVDVRAVRQRKAARADIILCLILGARRLHPPPHATNDQESDERRHRFRDEHRRPVDVSPPARQITFKASRNAGPALPL